MVRGTGVCVSECVGVKQRGGAGVCAMSPGGAPPCVELKGLKVSGVPSPPQTDRQGPSAQRTGEDGEEGGGGVAGLVVGC